MKLLTKQCVFKFHPSSVIDVDNRMKSKVAETVILRIVYDLRKFLE